MTIETKYDLSTPYSLSEDQIAYFRENGFIKLKQVLPADVLAFYGSEITRLVKALNTETLPMEQRSTYRKAFLQVMNLWEHSEIVKTFVFSPRLAKIAADLLEVSGTRLYHDQALYKEPGGGITPWHADQYYWPLATDRSVTVWIPFQDTPLEMGPLAFCAKSQHQDFGRALSISDESERQIQASLEAAQFEVIEEPFELGEVSYHLGWTFHRAGQNATEHPRAVMTMIYMDENMRLANPTNQQQVNDWHGWCPGAVIGEVIDTPKNPVLYSSKA
jgi:ectoine hydroxylase-related dioxygenase (phytanoyl-CoA dioxygenase family)